MKYLSYILLAVAALCACNASPRETPHTKPKPTSNASSGAYSIEHLSPKEFKEKIDALKGRQIIDVRTPAEVAEGIIPNAIHIDIMDASFAEKIKTLDGTKPVFVYCAAGGRSKQACDSMKDWGFREMYELEEGFSGWKSAGMEVVEYKNK